MSLKPPSYRRRTIRGKFVAYLTLRDSTTGESRDHWLGEYGSPGSRELYARLVAQWEESGRRFIGSAAIPMVPRNAITVAQIAAEYTVWSEANQDGKARSHVGQAVARLVELYGTLPAVQFGPNALRAVREAMARPRPKRRPWSRRYIGEQTRRIVAVFRWAASRELLPASVFESLRTIEPLRRGKCGAHDNPPVGPVAESMVNAVKPMVSRQVAAMIDLQLLTGARPGELCGLRPCDLITGGDVWSVRPLEHKTAHHGRERTIYFGPRAQAIVKRFLARPTDAPLFSPIEADVERRAKLTAKRKTPKGQGNEVGTNVSPDPKRKPKAAYTVNSYRRAIERACKAACVPRWFPYQLRHNYATNVRRQYGLEAAQILLGHSSALVTEAVYAERDEAKAMEVVSKIG